MLPIYRGILRKMPVSLRNNQAIYALSVGEHTIALNPLLGQSVQFTFEGVIFCVQCGRKTKKHFQQGYCFPCYKRLLSCNLCTIHPERCRYYEGVCQADDWAHALCGQSHTVYLANSSGLKVGITRSSQIPTRWIDQGATQGLVIFSVPNRPLAGWVETIAKKWLSDRTHWQAMLKKEASPLNLITQRDALFVCIQAEIKGLMERFSVEIHPVMHPKMTQIVYPIQQYLDKITALNFDKQAVIYGKLQGIKGQYLLLDTGVISMRKFAGYEVQVHITG